MNPRQARAIAARMLRMSDAEQQAFLRARRFTAFQLRDIGTAALRMRSEPGMQGLGLSFGNLFKNIGGALLPFASLVPGAGPIIAAAGTALVSSIDSGGSSLAPQTSPPPPPAKTNYGPVLILGAIALAVVLLK